MRWLTVGIGMMIGMASGCGPRFGALGPAPETVTVFAAASTKEPMEIIAKKFADETGIRVEVSPGPSSGLAKQIGQGAPADLFLSADMPNADYLDKKGLLEQRRVLLRNRLVVVVPSDSELQLQDLTQLNDPRVKRLALAEEKVPAGEYSREALKKAGVWDRVKDRVVGGTDVRVTLQLVEQGADAGMVYHTDAVVSKRVRIAFEVDPKLHRPIEYPLLLIKRPPAVKASARQFFDYLTWEDAAAVFRQAKFEPVR